MIYSVNHPSEIIPKESAEVIRRLAAEAEKLDNLHPDQIDLIYKHKWFKMFIPKEYGGLGWSLPEVLRVEESLSWADGSTGWVVTLCSGAGWFSGFLDASSRKEILLNDRVCFAGSGAATGIANRTSAGYFVTGQWKYASGSLCATVFTANCIIQDAGTTELNPDGSPVVGAFLFHKDEVLLHRQWKSIGMIATGSHSFEVKELAVPANRRLTIDGKHAILHDPVYQYPFLQMAEATLAVNLSGMAMNFVDLCDPFFSKKMEERKQPKSKRADLRELLANARAALNRYRHDFYTVVTRSWVLCERGETLPRGVLNQVTKTSHALAHGALRVVDELYPYCGLSATDPRTELNRVWRNIHTASQHALFASG
jgi:alkylation response protein AidB-like acyl-CoA dehydrogenase